MKTIRALVLAGVMGMLVDQNMGMSITGRVAWSCTYAVMGQTVTVVQDHMCEPSKMFY